MNRIVFTGLLLLSVWARAGDWVQLSSDDSSRLMLDAASVQRNASNEVRFQIQRIHNAQKDMMGLSYNAIRNDYLLACQSGQILRRQQFLLQDDEVVWTFPESTKVQKATPELSETVIQEVCRARP